MPGRWVSLLSHSEMCYFIVTVNSSLLDMYYMYAGRGVDFPEWIGVHHCFK